MKRNDNNEKSNNRDLKSYSNTTTTKKRPIGDVLEFKDNEKLKDSKPIWKQEVVDDKGRKRFHGAFTGGFSSGYFNSVGSKEGFTPTTFKSSRNAKATTIQSQPKDFMDEEDLNEYASKELSKSNFNLFDSVLSGTATSLLNKNVENEVEQQFLPGSVYQNLFGDSKSSGSDSIGFKLLKLMGISKSEQKVNELKRKSKQRLEGRVKKPKVTKSVSTHVEIPLEILSNLKDGEEISQDVLQQIMLKHQQKQEQNEMEVEDEEEDESDIQDEDNSYNYNGIFQLTDRIVNIKPKLDNFGIGYIQSGEIRNLRDSKYNQQQRQKQVNANVVSFKDGKGSSSLGLGALEDDEDDFDVYGNFSNSDIYDKSLFNRSNEQKVMSITSADSDVNRIKFLRPNDNNSHVIRCSDGSLPLNGFIVSKKYNFTSLDSKSYPPPTIPSDFVEYHQFKFNLDSHITSRSSQMIQPINSTKRSEILGEQQLPIKLDQLQYHQTKQPLQPQQSVISSRNSDFMKNAHSYLSDSDRRLRYNEFLLDKNNKNSDGEQYMRSGSSSGTLSEKEKQMELKEFEKYSQSFQSLATTLNSRFVSGGTIASDGTVSKTTTTENGANVKKVKSQHIVPWFPVDLLCKRFNIKNPYSREEFETHQNDQRKLKLSKYDWKSKLNISVPDSTSSSSSPSSSSVIVQPPTIPKPVKKPVSEIVNTEYRVTDTKKPPIDLFKAIFETSDVQETKDTSQENVDNLNTIINNEEEEEEELDPFSAFVKQQEKEKSAENINNNNSTTTTIPNTIINIANKKQESSSVISTVNNAPNPLLKIDDYFKDITNEISTSTKTNIDKNNNNYKLDKKREKKEKKIQKEKEKEKWVENVKSYLAQFSDLSSSSSSEDEKRKKKKKEKRKEKR
ncbi:putative G-patch-containing protein [Tieghemostelium lacteum]|uniref:Putative G-patch-containing protein n=1 Tax=Tieghemostelium lacteum TaxID=361077 RepID=A0A151Z5B8_TIELA|nr:putative G-patch-containing protein [Tieghemostelium lacteum]|eukprot:KYQ89156.1 putative G-patch-containing protein [Tieghemostelium lacteum]